MLLSAVPIGNVQLLPDGQLIIPMADHQTTGGYPVVAHVISVDTNSLAQLSNGQIIRFHICSEAEALHRFRQQQLHLKQLQNACNFRLAQL